MRELLLDPFTVPFMGRALVELVILGVLGGVVGVFVLLRRLAFTADALTHTVFPGVVIGYLFAGDGGVLVGALVAAALTAVALTLLTRGRRVSEDAALAILLTAMFSVGVILVSRRSSYTADLTAFLFGRLLTVTAEQIVQTAAVAVVALLALAATAKEQLLRAFDPITARAAGYRVGALDLLLNAVVALVVVASVRAVGTVLVIALLIVPAATGRLLFDRVWLIVVAGCVAAAASGYVGLVVSYRASVHHGVRLASGATVVLVLVAMYLVAAVSVPLRQWWRRRRPAAEVVDEVLAGARP